MDRDDAKEIITSKAEEKRRKAKEEEMGQIAMAIGAVFFVSFLIFVGIYELVQFCQTTGRCGR